MGTQEKVSALSVAQPRQQTHKPRKQAGTDNHPMTKPTDKTEAQTRQADQDLLFKGIVICLIGVAILLGPFFARSPAVQELLGGARVVGWFALVLGVAFLGQYFLRRRARR
jgi:uncharacterized membrane protein HdeD (DUF308 family)